MSAKPVTDERRAELLAAAAHWEALAEDQESTPSGAERRKIYRRTGTALRREADNGIALCACCLLPLGKKCGKVGAS